MNDLTKGFQRSTVTFLNRGRVVCLLAVGFMSGSCVLNAPLAHALQSLESNEGSAQQRVTVDQVQRIVANDNGERDAKLAQRLSGLELTERMSAAKRVSLEQSVRGSKSRSALVALADASAFLDPPAADLLSNAPPDVSQQRHMMALTMDYLNQILPKLPDFYATRTTDGFSREQEAGAISQEDLSWRKVDSRKVVVTYRDGKEVINPREWGKHPSHPDGEGLITRGTFGPILLCVIFDAAHGQMVWDRWERGTDGTLAVFGYRVPEDQSHYSAGLHGPLIDSSNAAQGTGYQGEVAIDPATGTILRLTVQADPPRDSLNRRSDIMVEYGPVVIGGRTYTCPVRSVSISVVTSMGGLENFLPNVQAPQSTLLNDVTFADYHQFRATSRILTGNIPTSNQ